MLKRIDRIRDIISEKYRNKKSFFKELNNLNKELNNIGFEFMKHRNSFAKNINDDFVNVNAKKAYLDFVMKHKVNATKSQLYIANDIQNEIRLNSKDIAKSISMQNELDSMLLQHLGLKSTSKSLIFAQKDIIKKLNVIDRIDKYNFDDTRLLDTYKDTLQTNSVMIDRIINDKILHYESIFKDKDNIERYNVKTLQYYFKEFENLTSYIDNKIDSNSDNLRRSKKDFKLLQVKINNLFLDKENEFKKQEHDFNRKKFYYDFIEWYIVDRDLNNDRMRKSLQNKYENNTLDEYLEKYDKTALIDYKVYLKMLENEKQKNIQKDNKGLER